MVDGIDPTTGQKTDGFGVITGPEPDLGENRPYRPLTGDHEELASDDAALSTDTPAAPEGRRKKEDNPYFLTFE